MAQNHPTKDNHDGSYRVPLIGENYWRNHGVMMDSIFINGYPENFKNPLTGEGRQVFVKRPGLQSTTTLTNTLHTDVFNGLGLTENNMKCVANKAISGLTDSFICIFVDVSSGSAYVIRYRPANGSASIRVGTIASLGGAAADAAQDYFCIEECQIDNAGTTYVGITVTRTRFDRAASSGWYARAGAADFTAASLTQIVAAAYPDQAGRVTTGPLLQMNGLFHVMATDGTVWTSGTTTGTINDPTLWSSLSWINTYQDPDSGIGLSRYKNHILACSTNSIEFLNDVGNPPPASPLERTDQALIRFGVLHPKAYINIGDHFYWISAGERNTHGIWRLEGYTPVKVSTTREDKMLLYNRNSNPKTFSDMDMSAFVFSGKLHLIINGLAITGSLFYYGTASTYYFGQSTDTWYTKGATPSKTHDRSMLRAGTLCYSIDDNVWWGWMMYPGAGATGYNGAAYALKPAMSVRAETSTNWTSNYLQVYCFVSALNTAALADVPNTTVMAFASTTTTTGVALDPGGYWDWNDKNTGTYNFQPVTVIIGYQTLDFGNSDRKRINSAELIFAEIPQQRATNAGHSAATDTNVYSYSLCINKTNHMASTNLPPDHNTNIIRTDDYPNMDIAAGSAGASVNAYGLPDRFGFSNLGMARYWNFAILCESRDPFPLEYLELDVMQGTH